MNPITIARVPVREGFDWITLSLRIFRAQWMRYTSLAALFLLLLQLATALSGGLLFPFLKPILSVGMLAAAWHHERGEPPEVKHLFAGFKSNLKALLPLGFVLFGAVLFALALAVSMSGITTEQMEDFQKWILSDPRTGDSPIGEGVLQSMMLWSTLFMLPMLAALWFAPALIVFNDAGVMRALGASLRAVIHNIGPVLVYWATVIAMSLCVMVAASPFLLMAPGAGTFIIQLLAVPIFAILMISDYVSFRRIFHRDERVQRVKQ